MELQPTDFENAAFTVFVVLLCGAILAFDLNFYIPMSKVCSRCFYCYYVVLNVAKVDENIARAQKRDAVRTGKFFFRKSVLPPGYISPLTGPLSSSESCTPKKGRDDIPERERVLGSCFHRVPSPPVADALIEDEYEEMTMEEIFSGKVGIKHTRTAVNVTFITGHISWTTQICGGIPQNARYGSF